MPHRLVPLVPRLLPHRLVPVLLPHRMAQRLRAWRGRWQLVQVSGPSMVPELRDGDLVLVRHRASIRPGDVVLARFRSIPDRLVIKRVVRVVADGWWLASDNRFAGGDSTTHGGADVLARVTMRLSPGRPRWVRRKPRWPTRR